MRTKSESLLPPSFDVLALENLSRTCESLLPAGSPTRGIACGRRLADDCPPVENQLKTFAEMTGGLNFAPLFPGELPDDFGQINNSIRNQYLLTYRPTNAKNDGSYRKIKVLLVDNEGHPLQMQDEKGKPLKYSVIARDGYNAKLPVQ